MPHATVNRIRIHKYDQTALANALRGVGFRAVCGEHWRGKNRRLYRSAALDARAHNKTEHR